MAKAKKTAEKKESNIVTLQEVVSPPSAPVDPIDTEKLISDITKAVTERLTAEFEQKLSSAISKVSQSTEQRRDRLVLTGSQQYFLDATSDGLEFTRDKDIYLLLSRDGQLGIGTRSPRSVGKGSLHVKAGAPSEGVIPSSGLHSTRGAIIEGDGDDDKTYALRVVSRMNRQGVNVFSDGALSLGTLDKIDNSTLNVYHRHAEGSVAKLFVPSLQYEDSALEVKASTAPSSNWKAIAVTANNTEVSAIDGNGSVFSNGTFYSNNTGYSEMFEWADNNAKKENRVGFTVSLDKNGKLLSADEGDNVIGVVVAQTAIVGNSAWNHWQGKFSKDELLNYNLESYNIIEWLENETTTLKSHYKFELPNNFIVPENAVEIQTDKYGENFKTPKVDHKYDSNKTYLPRFKRTSWATVCVLGVVPVYKGQQMGKNWIKVRDLTDEVELWLIK